MSDHPKRPAPSSFASPRQPDDVLETALTTETCTIKISIRDAQGDEEDWVKDIWPRMLPWFTRRHGVQSGRIELADGAVAVEWKYDTEPTTEGTSTEGAGG